MDDYQIEVLQQADGAWCVILRQPDEYGWHWENVDGNPDNYNLTYAEAVALAAEMRAALDAEADAEDRDAPTVEMLVPVMEK